MISKYKLDQLGSVNRGKSKHRPRNDPDLYGGKYPFIQTGDVKHSPFYVTSHSQTYNEKGLAQSKLWNKGTLCITIAANIADTAILSYPACFPDSIIGFVADTEKSHTKYVKYCLDTFKLQMQSISQGTTQDNMSVEKLLSIDFPAPNLQSQNKIAATLSAYDDLIENNKRRISLLEKMAEEIYREWFVRFRFPGYKNAEFEKGIPKKWAEKNISDFVNFKSGFSFKSKSYEQGSQYGIVTIKNVHNGKFIPDCSDSIAEPPSNLPEHCFIEKGNILMSLTGNVGRVCIAYGNNLVLNQRVALLKPKVVKHSHYIYWLFRQKSMTTFCEMISTGAAQQNLSPIKLGSQKLFYPDEKSLEKYQVIVDPVMEEISILLHLNRMLEKAKNMLLPRLISGKLSVENLDIQFPPSMQQEVSGAAEV